MSWFIALAVIVLIALLPLGVSVRYDEGGLLVRLCVGPARFTVYPRRKKKEKPEEEPAQPSKDREDKPREDEPREEQPEKEPVQPRKVPRMQPAKKKLGGRLTEFYPLLKTGLAFLNELRRKLRVKRLEARLILAGDDPCDLAVNYGRAWAAVGNLMPILERTLKIKKRDVQVECDFDGDTTRVYVRTDVTVAFGRALWLVLRYGFRAMRQYLKIQKGGAENEQKPS